MRGPLTGRRLAAVTGGLGAVCLALAVVASLLGAVPIDVERALQEPGSTDHAILWSHRLPRVAQALVVGAVLAASGAALQGLLRNALADPFVLGVSGGAALGAASVGLTALGGVVGRPVGGFVGALGALVLITALTTRRGRISPLHMLLAGVVFNAFSGSVLMVLQAIGDPRSVQRILLWLMGSVAVDPSQPMLLPVVLAAATVGIGILMLRARAFDLVGLGDDAARSLGVDPDRLRRLTFVALSVAVGAVVAATGLIGFVGLIVPHAVRLTCGPDHRLLLPASALGGGAFVLAADLGVRLLAVPLGTELPVGVLTTGLGGPLFLWLASRDVRGTAS